jgi:hypothetical protein
LEVLEGWEKLEVEEERPGLSRSPRETIAGNQEAI